MAFRFEDEYTPKTLTDELYRQKVLLETKEDIIPIKGKTVIGKYEGVHFYPAQFYFSEFQGCYFIDCNFSDTWFQNCLFKYCLFKDCFARDFDLENCFLENCKFEDCYFEKSFLENVFFDGCNFNDVESYGVTLKKIINRNQVGKKLQRKSGKETRLCSTFIFNTIEK